MIAFYIILIILLLVLLVAMLIDKKKHPQDYEIPNSPKKRHVSSESIRSRNPRMRRYDAERSRYRED